MSKDRLDFTTYVNGESRSPLRPLASGPSLTPQEPIGDWIDLPPDFTDKLSTACQFVGGKHPQMPLMQYVFLLDKHLYATNNECIVQVAVDVPGEARFLVEEAKAVKALAPTRMLRSHEAVAFAGDGSWCQFERVGPDADANMSLAATMKDMIDQHWERASDEVDIDVPPPTKDERTFETAGAAFSRSNLRRVLAITKRVGFDSDPVVFGDGDTKGLMVPLS